MLGSMVMHHHTCSYRTACREWTKQNQNLILAHHWSPERVHFGYIYNYFYNCRRSYYKFSSECCREWTIPISRKTKTPSHFRELFFFNINLYNKENGGLVKTRTHTARRPNPVRLKVHSNYTYCLSIITLSIRALKILGRIWQQFCPSFVGTYIRARSMLYSTEILLYVYNYAMYINYINILDIYRGKALKQERERERGRERY